MLGRIGVSSIDDLFADIPADKHLQVGSCQRFCLRAKLSYQLPALVVGQGRVDRDVHHNNCRQYWRQASAEGLFAVVLHDVVRHHRLVGVERARWRGDGSGRSAGGDNIGDKTSFPGSAGLDATASAQGCQ